MCTSSAYQQAIIARLRFFGATSEARREVVDVVCSANRFEDELVAVAVDVAL